MDRHQQLVKYISEQFQQGQTPDDISMQLVQAGWQKDQIEQAFLAVQANVVPSHMHQPAPAAAASNTSPLPQANGSRKGRIAMGWRLLKHSLNLLNGNRYLMRYFVMTWAMVILINAVIIAIILLASPDFFASDSNWYPLVFISYLIIYCVINFYGAALACNILDIYKGEMQTYSVYLNAARAKFWPIFIYSLMFAIIGTILEYIIEKFGRLGQLISWLVGTAWSLSTLFTLPIIMDTSSSAPSAVRESFRLFRKTWGEGVTAKATAGTPIFLLQVLLAFTLSALFYPVAFTGSVGLIYLLVFIYLFLALSLAVIGSYASSFLNVALYYYAINHKVPPGFDADMLNQVFVKSKRQLKKEANTAKS